MNAPVDRIKDVAGAPRQGRTTFRVLSFSAIVAVLAVLAFFTINTNSAEAASVPFNTVEPLYTQFDAFGAFGSPDEAAFFLSATDVRPLASSVQTTQNGESDQSTSHAGFEAVWMARVTVGMATDGTTTILGYSSSMSPQLGDLDIHSFTYAGESYVVDNLVLQQVSGVLIQVVLSLNQRLPDGWYFQAKSGEYAVQDSLVLGSGQNIHAWRLDSLPDWTEGETIQVALWRDIGPQGQEGEPFQGPEFVDTLPGLSHPDRTLSADDTLPGEIEESGQFISYKLVFEPGKAYRLDMKGEASGDGTLSDPWVSGIRGAFQTEHGIEMQPVWYDELGRNSTDITWPDGESFVLDQNGRYFTVGTDSNGDPVLRPPMGANDDGGEGFNSRLFLVNFPAREYEIVVSGSPNPSPVGTFTISLADVSEDDYGADAENAGELSVGEAASGELEVPGDADWFAVELTEGTRYEVSVKGRATGDGTLAQARLAGIYDSNGTLIPGTANNFGSSFGSSNATLDFTPGADGVYYIAAAGLSPYRPNRSDIPVGSYTVGITAAADM